MCIMALALDTQPDFPVILVFNRDERFDRKTTDLAVHEDGCVYAMDEQAGGTWMAISPNGTIAALTNVRCASPAAAQLESRGQLVKRILCGDDSAIFSRSFAAFNLLHGTLRLPGHPEGSSKLWLSASTPADRGEGPWATSSVAVTKQATGPAVYCKTNDSTGKMMEQSTLTGSEAAWPKAEWLRAEVSAILEHVGECCGREGAEKLMCALEPAINAEQLPPHMLQRAEATRGEYTNADADMERRFQRGPFLQPFDLARGQQSEPIWYGTVSQSAILLCTSEQCAFFAYRETARPSTKVHGPWQWQKMLLSTSPQSPGLMVGTKQPNDESTEAPGLMVGTKRPSDESTEAQSTKRIRADSPGSMHT